MFLQNQVHFGVFDVEAKQIKAYLKNKNKQTKTPKPKLGIPNKKPLLIQVVLNCQECVISSYVPVL